MVNVITSEFLQDFAYFEINDLGYTSSVNNFDNGGINEPAASPNRGYTLSHDGRRTLSLPSYTVVDLGLSYRLRLADSKFSHSVRLNVKNLTDADCIDTGKRAGDRRSFYVSYASNH